MTRFLRPLVFLALPYLPFVAGRTLGQGVVAAAWIAAAALWAPGLLGATWSGGGLPGRFAGGLLAATLFNIVTIVTLMVLGTAPTAQSYGTALGVWVLVGAVATIASGRKILPQRRRSLTYLVAAVVGVLAFFSGTRVVPPLEDQDSEVQGTAYGLVHHLQPICLTNRSTLYYFAHPPLLHLFSAATLTLSGQLELVRPPYDAALIARDRMTDSSRGRGIGAAIEALRHPPRRQDHYILWKNRVLAAFEKTPALFGTRLPNFLFAGFAAALLFQLIRRLGATKLDAVLVVAVTMTLPEIFVRSGYGGYFSLTVCTFLAAAWMAAEGGNSARAGLMGVLAALTSQKAVVLGVAFVGARVQRAVAGRAVPALGPVLTLAAGMLAGVALFWTYGLFIAPNEFVADHLLDHGLRRFYGREAASRAGQLVYPGPVALWAEFARHMGWLWTALAIGAWGRSLWHRSHGSDFSRNIALLFAFWAVIGAVLFTATDWRQTKHLCLIVPALAVLIGRWCADSGRLTRVGLRGALALSLAWNVVWIYRLAHDFDALPMSTLW